MSNGKLVRKEVYLSAEVLEVLARLATDDERSMKQYMERVLTSHAAANQRKVAALTGKEIDIKSPLAAKK